MMSVHDNGIGQSLKWQPSGVNALLSIIRAFAKADRNVEKGLPFCHDAQELFKRFNGANVYTAELAPLNRFSNQNTCTILSTE